MSLFEGAWTRWLRNGLAGLALIMALIVVYYGAQVRGVQDKVETGRADLVKAQTFASIDNNLIQLLANTAVQKNDDQIRALLAANGVTFQAQPGAAAPSAGSDSSASKGAGQ